MIVAGGQSILDSKLSNVKNLSRRANWGLMFIIYASATKENNE